MNHRIWSSLSVTLLTTTLGTATAGYAQQTKATSQGSEGDPTTTQVQQVPATVSLSSAQPAVEPPEVVKVGELQSRRIRTQEAEVIAKIHSYELQGRQVATLYVRSIPVLTFLGSPSASADAMKIGQAQLRPYSSPQPYSQKTPSSGASENTAVMAQPRRVSDASNAQNDAVWRATAVAAKLNQLSLNNVPAEAIAVRWQPECNCYSINVNNQELVQINNRTFLADTTQNLATDALQATNRLRRLMGNAPPLQEIIGMPVDRKSVV